MSVRRAHEFCLTKLEGYSNKDAVKTDIVATLHNFTDLRPSRDVFQSNGQSRDMVNLKGTIPVFYKGTTYNIPICLYLDRQHPHQPPICLVKPTDAMSVRVGDHVDEDGRVTLPYQREWSHPNSDIVTFIQMMQIHFGEVCPVFTRSKSVSRNAVEFCRTNLENYPNKDSVKSDLDKTLKRFTDLRLSRAAFVCDGGNRTMVRVSGTIPVLHRGSTYNVPICMFVEHEHPQLPPISFVQPTANMVVHAGRCVDATSRINLPYQQSWRNSSSRRSDIVGLVEAMQQQFSAEPPVYTIPAAAAGGVSGTGTSDPPAYSQLYPGGGCPTPSVLPPPYTREGIR